MKRERGGERGGGEGGGGEKRMVREKDGEGGYRE